ncbi:glucosamine-6-phosphate deaminase [Curtobacterium sp. MCBD17_034]|uniref:glucosamine-6-phosphate deaminase n=1 Tax=unclassified Curtobacterium TaxID=257496 RepID=UPI000DA9AD47|nr:MULTISPECIES: glucosamine-6-phosphate deaminase [unclassified Curtobacterium]PZE76099.1 glucosamine-6-phosphate deaminase [Curtobacterium sp. MCBD17_019]PZF60257.1 glucosamine-6-phosphate deaminase [Curtobacterium sp. MCBD17_034]PZM34942.1 glucosamine-6-phosphate deaminase [Curtobacterium sp. MCBD17_031]WIE54318.1 glucosamine-6-phosphate deaminase [Curtobacterium sp. MCBD17_003]
MEIIILPTAVEVGRMAAAKIASVVSRKPSAVIGLATGSSPQDIYADLARRVQGGEISFAQARGFALDEYVGIPLEHPESYASVIARDVVGPLGFDPARVRVPDGRAADLEFAAKEYDAAIRAAGGIDVQILGIGANGHIGFNEPTSSFASRTRIKTLAPATRAANARFFDSVEEVPMHCMTQGLGTILEARELVLVAQGEGKAAAVAGAVEGPVSSFVPGSALQLHEHATVIVDEAAAAQLQLADYYRHVFANKPAWQRFDETPTR